MVNISYWYRDEQKLFDFKATDNEIITRKIFLTRSTTILVDPLTNDLYYTNDYVDNEYTDSLRKIKIILDNSSGESNFIECMNKQLQQNTKCWLKIDNNVKNKSSKWLLPEGSYFRLGQQVIKVTKIYAAKNQFNKKTKSEDNKINSNADGQITESHTYGKVLSDYSSVKRCRICLEQEKVDNPFEFHLCKCSEKMPTHIICLSEWLKKRCFMASVANVTLYNVSNMKCDVCGETYPLETKIHGENKNLLSGNMDLQITQILLNIYELEALQLKMVVVIKIRERNKIIRLGKYDKNELVFKDNSISHLHAYLIWQDGELCLYDNDSRFGTFTIIPDRISISDVMKKQILMDKYCLSFISYEKEKPAPTNNFIFRDPISNDQRLFAKKNNIIDIRNINTTPIKVREARAIGRPVDLNPRSKSYVTQQTGISKQFVSEYKPKNAIVNRPNIREANTNNPLKSFGIINTFNEYGIVNQNKKDTFYDNSITDNNRTFKDVDDEIPYLNQNINGIRRTIGNINFNFNDKTSGQITPQKKDKKLIKSFKDMKIDATPTINKTPNRDNNSNGIQRFIQVSEINNYISHGFPSKLRTNRNSGSHTPRFGRY